MAPGATSEGGHRTLISPRTAETRCKAFIRAEVSAAGAKGAVVGVSGGVDSAVVVTLCAKALKPNNVRGVVMPSESTPRQDVTDASDLCGSLGVPVLIFNIGEVLHAFRVNPELKVPYGNLKARVRMAYLYYLSNLEHRLVVGTGDKSEDTIGYFTKYGDGGVDISPIADLYKTEVRALAKHLGVPARICSKPSSPQLWGGHSAEEELGASYEEIDRVLMADKLGKVWGSRADLELAGKLRRMTHANEHKLNPPPVLKFR